MDSNNKIYEQLKENYSDKEIGEGMLVPTDLSEEERKKAKEELLAFRFQLLENQTEKDRIYSDLLRFKYQIQNYLMKEPFDTAKSLGKHLEEYARILKKTKKDLAEDLAIHYTRLSQIINERKEANIALMYRLEKHSGGIIPAVYWWKLMIKKQEAVIKTSVKLRQEEGEKVRNPMIFEDK